MIEALGADTWYVCVRAIETPAQDGTAYTRRPVAIDRSVALRCQVVAVHNDGVTFRIVVL